MVRLTFAKVVNSLYMRHISLEKLTNIKPCRPVTGEQGVR
nr:MAG TPA: hypothetical protein [Caudoviricetes sp.]